MPRIKVSEQVRERRIGKGSTLGEGRVQAPGKEVILGQDLVVENSESRSDRGLAMRERIPCKTDPRRKILQRGVGIPLPTYGHCRIRHVAQVRDLSVRLCRNGDKLITQTEIERQIRAHTNIVLNEKSEEALPIPAVRIDAAWQSEIELARDALQEIGEARKREQPAYLARSVLIELYSLPLKASFDAVRSTSPEHRIASMPVVEAIEARQAVIAEIFGCHSRDGQESQQLSGNPGEIRRYVHGALVVRFVVRAAEPNPCHVHQR